MKKDDIQEENLKHEPEETSLEVEESAVEDEVVKLREELESTKEAAIAADNNYKRALADYQNLQKRTQEDRQQWILGANRELLLRIMTVLDTLMLAQQHVQDKNLEVSIQQFLDVLKSEGVIRIETEGKKFDPHLMEAIATGEGKEGEVLEELRAGFLLHDKLLRAAQVKVGKE
ncbi:MAG: nucleotide exchange factor GrpE [Candidatus Levyibacteriota bacterium]